MALYSYGYPLETTLAVTFPFKKRGKIQTISNISLQSQVSLK